MRALDLIAAAQAARKTHVVISTYADGTTHRFEASSAEAANNYAKGESRKIGRDLVDRETGATVRVVAVEVQPLA